MRTIKVRDLSFKRRFLDCEIYFIVFDVYETITEGETVTMNITRVFWVFPKIADDMSKKEEVFCMENL